MGRYQEWLRGELDSPDSFGRTGEQWAYVAWNAAMTEAARLVLYCPDCTGTENDEHVDQVTLNRVAARLREEVGPPLTKRSEWS